MGLPLDVRDLVKHGSQVRHERELPVRLAIVLEADASDALIDAVREALRPNTVNARVQVVVAEPGTTFDADPTLDAIVAVIGSGLAGAVDALSEPRRRAIPVVAVATGPSRARVAETLMHPIEDTLVDEDVTRVVDDDLAHWLADRLTGSRLALAHNFPFVRRAVARDAVRATAWQNALVGGVAILPGADMPLMTANQAKMLLQIAAAYGQRLGPERVKEVAAVVGGGVVFRSVARQLLALVPGFGWAVKAGVAYSGTIAMGEAAIAYFERDADLVDVAAWLVAEGQDAAGRAGRRARARLPRREAASAQTDPAATSARASTEPIAVRDASEPSVGVAGD